MKCLYCDAQLPYNAVFCPVCGSPVIGETPEESDPETATRRRKAHLRRVGIVVGCIVGASAAAATITTIAILNYRKKFKNARTAAFDAAKRAAKAAMSD
jgi:hypothetical protein